MSEKSSNTTIKDRLKSGEKVAGPFVRISDPATTEILGNAGFDFVIIDLEHGPGSISQAENIIRAAKLVGLTTIIRVRENSPTLIQRALDAGASGVQIPQINDEEMARDAVESAKFHPLGSRGVCRFTRASQYSHIPGKEYFATANEETMVVLQVEGKEGVENIDKILDVGGFDVLFIGPYDLSQALGIPGEVDHPKIIQTIQEIKEKANSRGIAVGAFADNLSNTEKLINMDLQYLSFGIDTGIFYEATKSLVGQVQNLINGKVGAR